MIKCKRCDCNTTHDYIANLDNGQHIGLTVCLDCITEDEHDQLDNINNFFGEGQ